MRRSTRAALETELSAHNIKTIGDSDIFMQCVAAYEVSNEICLRESTAELGHATAVDFSNCATACGAAPSTKPTQSRVSLGALLLRAKRADTTRLINMRALS